MATKTSIWFDGDEYRWGAEENDYVYRTTVDGRIVKKLYSEERERRGAEQYKKNVLSQVLKGLAICYGKTGDSRYADALKNIRESLSASNDQSADKVRYAATGAEGVKGIQGVDGSAQGAKGVQGIGGAKPKIWFNGYDYEYDPDKGEYVRYVYMNGATRPFTLKQAITKAAKNDLKDPEKALELGKKAKKLIRDAQRSVEGKKKEWSQTETTKQEATMEDCYTCLTHGNHLRKAWASYTLTVALMKKRGYSQDEIDKFTNDAIDKTMDVFRRAYKHNGRAGAALSVLQGFSPTHAKSLLKILGDGTMTGKSPEESEKIIEETVRRAFVSGAKVVAEQASTPQCRQIARRLLESYNKGLARGYMNLSEPRDAEACRKAFAEWNQKQLAELSRKLDSKETSNVSQKPKEQPKEQQTPTDGRPSRSSQGTSAGSGGGSGSGTPKTSDRGTVGGRQGGSGPSVQGNGVVTESKPQSPKEEPSAEKSGDEPTDKERAERRDTLKRLLTGQRERIKTLKEIINSVNEEDLSQSDIDKLIPIFEKFEEEEEKEANERFASDTKSTKNRFRGADKSSAWRATLYTALCSSVVTNLKDIKAGKTTEKYSPREAFKENFGRYISCLLSVHEKDKAEYDSLKDAGQEKQNDEPQKENNPKDASDSENKSGSSVIPPEEPKEEKKPQIEQQGAEAEEPKKETEQQNGQGTETPDSKKDANSKSGQISESKTTSKPKSWNKVLEEFMNSEEYLQYNNNLERATAIAAKKAEYDKQLEDYKKQKAGVQKTEEEPNNNKPKNNIYDRLPMGVAVTSEPEPEQNGSNENDSKDDALDNFRNFFNMQEDDKESSDNGFDFTETSSQVEDEEKNRRANPTPEPPKVIEAPIAVAQAPKGPGLTPGIPEKIDYDQVYEVPINHLKVDPKRFQFKLGGNEETGAGDLYNGAEFDLKLSNTIMVWRDPADGEDYVVNGHHRMNIARKSGYTGNMRVVYCDAKTAEEAKVDGAIFNIADGKGTEIDVADIMRNCPDWETNPKVKTHISRNNKLAENGRALAGLSEKIYSRVKNGDLDWKLAVPIGKILGIGSTNMSKEDAEEAQIQACNLAGVNSDKKKKPSIDHVRRIAQTIANTVPSTGGGGMGLFGGAVSEKDWALKIQETAKLTRDVEEILSDEKRTNRFAANRKNTDKLNQNGVYKGETDADLAKKYADAAKIILESFKDTNDVAYRSIFNKAKMKYEDFISEHPKDEEGRKKLRKNLVIDVVDQFFDKYNELQSKDRRVVSPVANKESTPEPSKTEENNAAGENQSPSEPSKKEPQPEPIPAEPPKKPKTQPKPATKPEPPKKEKSNDLDAAYGSSKVWSSPNALVFSMANEEGKSLTAIPYEFASEDVVEQLYQNEGENEFTYVPDYDAFIKEGDLTQKDYNFLRKIGVIDKTHKFSDGRNQSNIDEARHKYLRDSGVLDADLPQFAKKKAPTPNSEPPKAAKPDPQSAKPSKPVEPSKPASKPKAKESTKPPKPPKEPKPKPAPKKKEEPKPVVDPKYRNAGKDLEDEDKALLRFIKKIVGDGKITDLDTFYTDAARAISTKSNPLAPSYCESAIGYLVDNQYVDVDGEDAISISEKGRAALLNFDKKKKKAAKK